MRRSPARPSGWPPEMLGRARTDLVELNSGSIAVRCRYSPGILVLVRRVVAKPDYGRRAGLSVPGHQPARQDSSIPSSMKSGSAGQASPGRSAKPAASDSAALPPSRSYTVHERTRWARSVEEMRRHWRSRLASTWRRASSLDDRLGAETNGTVFKPPRRSSTPVVNLGARCLSEVLRRPAGMP